MKKVRNVLGSIFMAALLMGFTCQASQAGPTLITGTQRLLTDVQGWMLGLEVVITGALAIFRGIKWQKAEEEEKLRAQKSFVHAIVGGVVVISLTALVPFIFSYYQS